MGTVVVIGVLLLALAWFFWPGKAPARRSGANAELEQAEREVQEAPDEETVRDWGPGTGQKPLP